MAELVTERLRLRQWRDADLDPFAALNADPEVMRHFVSVMTRAQSDEFAAGVRAKIARDGWGLWAIEVTDGTAFIGFVGLNRPRFEAHFTPAVEVGWRLARQYWGNGFATEAAAAALTFGFEQLDLEEIVSFTAPVNERSTSVMRRLGMSHDQADDFDHPNVPGGPLRRHVLYRISKDNWLRRDHVGRAGAQLTSQATVSTTKPAAYMRQLCKHFGQRVPTAYDDSTGRITFEFGSCELVAGADQLTLVASAAQTTELDRLKQVVGSHLERFGRRDQLEVNWSERAVT